MTDIFLYAGDATPNNVVMSDPTVQRGGTTVNYTLPLAVGSYVYAGIAASIGLARNLASAVGSYTYTGIPATLGFARNLALAKGVYTYAGIAAQMGLARNLSAATGAYAYSGKTASLTVARNFALGVGAYSYLGKAITVDFERKLALPVGAYAYVGLQATLTYVPGAGAINYVLALASGSYAYSGKNAQLGYIQGNTGGGSSDDDWEKFKKKLEVPYDFSIAEHNKRILAKASHLNEVERQAKSRPILTLPKQKQTITAIGQQPEDDNELMMILSELA